MPEELESYLRRDGIGKVRNYLVKLREIDFQSIAGDDLNVPDIIETVMQDINKGRVKFNCNYFFAFLASLSVRFPTPAPISRTISSGPSSAAVTILSR